MKDDMYAEVLEYLAGRMTRESQQQFEQRLKTNPELRLLVEDMEDIAAQVDNGLWRSLREPVHELVTKIVAAAKEIVDDDPPFRGLVTFDSRLLPLPEGVRPASVGMCRMKYSLGPYRVELSCRPQSASTYEVMGQIDGWQQDLPPTLTLRGGTAKYTTTASQFAIYRFDRVPAKPYSLQISDGSTIVGELTFEL